MYRCDIVLVEKVKFINAANTHICQDKSSGFESVFSVLTDARHGQPS
jgi:hypothetical protein